MGHRSDQPEARLARLAVFAMRARCAHLPGVFGHLRVRAVAAARRAGPGVPGLSRGVASVERTEVASEAHDGDGVHVDVVGHGPVGLELRQDVLDERDAHASHARSRAARRRSCPVDVVQVASPTSSRLLFHRRYRVGRLTPASTAMSPHGSSANCLAGPRSHRRPDVIRAPLGHYLVLLSSGTPRYYLVVVSNTE